MVRVRLRQYSKLSTPVTSPALANVMPTRNNDVALKKIGSFLQMVVKHNVLHRGKQGTGSSGLRL